MKTKMKLCQFYCEESFIYLFKVEAAKASKTMKDFMIEAINEKIERENKTKTEKKKDDK